MTNHRPPTHHEPDPTLVRNQPTLTTSTGRIWMIVGSALFIVCAGVLVALSAVHATVAWTGVVVVTVLYAAMWVARYAVRAQRMRLLTLAALFGAIAAATLVCVIATNVVA